MKQTMQISCKQCGEIIRSENIDHQQQLAECPTCNVVFSLADLPGEPHQQDVARPAQHDDTPTPTGIIVDTHDDELKITYQWRSSGTTGDHTRVMLFWFLATPLCSMMWLAAVCGGITIGMVELSRSSKTLAEIGHRGFVIILVLATVLLWITMYKKLVKYYNKTVIRINSTTLEVSHTPLPYWANKRFNPADIKWLYSERKGNASREKNKSDSYKLYTVTKDGRHHQLLDDLPQPGLVMYLERKIEQSLNLKDFPTPGELSVSSSPSSLTTLKESAESDEQISCKYCGIPIPPENIYHNQQWAQCPMCNVLVSLVEPARLAVTLPSEFKVEASDHTLNIEQSGFFRPTVINVSPNVLRVNNKRFDLTTLRQVYSKRKIDHNGEDCSYELYIVLQDGSYQKLLDKIPKPEQGLYLAHKMEQFLLAHQSGWPYPAQPGDVPLPTGITVETPGDELKITLSGGGVIKVNPETLEIERSLRKDIQLKSATIEQLCSQRRISTGKGGTHYHYEFWVMTNDGQQQMLLDNLRTPEEIMYLKGKIELHLGIEYRLVPGGLGLSLSYRPTTKDTLLWKTLAARHKLNYVPATKKPQLSGTYRGYDLDLKASLKEDLGGPRTRLVVTADRSQSSDELLTPRDVEQLLPPTGNEFGLGAVIKAEEQALSYEHHRSYLDLNFLQFLFDRFCDLLDAYPNIVALGGEVVPALQTVAGNRDNPLHHVARWLLQEIERDTTERLGEQASRPVCPDCLTRCGPHQVKIRSRDMITYYGCRTCGRSRELLDVSAVVAVLLDSGQSQTEISVQNDLLRVNWAIRRELFDFDAVEIVQATDEEVGQFVAQVSNTVDFVQWLRYKGMPCAVAPVCTLSKNSLQSLQRTFGAVIEGTIRADQVDLTLPHSTDQIQLSGSHRGYHFEFETRQLTEKVSHIRLVLTASQSPGSTTTQKDGLEPDRQLTPQDVEQLLTLALTGSGFNLAGIVEIEARGQAISYEQKESEPSINFVRFLFDKLCDLLDAYPRIVTLGGQAAPLLQTISSQNDQPLRRVAHQLLREIAQDTTERLSQQASDLLCSDCLTRCVPRKIEIGMLETVTYYSCLVCGQSQEFLAVAGTTVIAVLDSQMASERLSQGQTLRVNWLARRRLFDFDQIEIGQATDEDVERFAVQVGNDTDPVRKPRYKEMRCVVSPDCRLSENTMRILRRTFGVVKI